MTKMGRGLLSTVRSPQVRTTRTSPILASWGTTARTLVSLALVGSTSTPGEKRTFTVHPGNVRLRPTSSTSSPGAGRSGITA